MPELYGMSPREYLRNLDIHIMECHMMIDHFIQLNNKTEIAYWRRVLQSAKLDKRRVAANI